MFHLALLFFAAVQIHETKTALVRRPDCDGSDDYVVCSSLYRPYRLANSHVPSKSCGGPGTLYKKVEHFLFAVPATIAAAWVILIFFVRALYFEFG